MFRGWLDEYLPEYTALNLIQVGGTNGKGSTCQWLNFILEKEGYKVGVFTSPHLISHTERIRVNSENISFERWEMIFDKYEQLFKEKEFTMFEMDLFMAVAYFIAERIDWGIIEVGMGGRLDATTALNYKATLITNIGKDHMEYLGETLHDIAIEKSGIFKPDVPAIAYDTTCFSVMEEQALQKHTSLVVADYDLSRYDLSKLPAYQRENLTLALSALEMLHLLKPAVVQEVINSFVWEGRFMVVREDPLLIVDGAHNVPGIQALIRSLKGFHGTIYFSALKEKEVDRMIRILFEFDSDLVLVHFDSYRVCDIEGMAQRFGLPCITFEEMKYELDHTQGDSLVCGSLYFIGDVLKWVEKSRNHK
ncbi:dihydrofolate synthase [Erysipelotrichaceae bacterium OPF54]|nr:dihydrofolate synthase [Erysipelotrichaceae bacterium OPF54]